jgi:two-component system sensor histidine kinase QseC
VTILSRAWAALRQPTLTGRVMGVLLGAAVLCFATLVGIDWLALRLGGPELRALPAYTQGLLASLPTPPEPIGHAVAVVRAAEQQINQARRSSDIALGDLLLRLQQADGSLRYASAAWPADLRLPDPLPADGRITLGDRTYWAELCHSPQWRLTVLEPEPGDAAALRWLGGDLVASFLISLPLMLAPLWWSVRRGLRPLRQLVHTVSRRAADDASPLGVDLRYAELQPLVLAFEAQLAKARAQIERERALTQDAAHELRTPLAVISAQAHLVCATGTAAERQQARAALEHAVQRASHLVHQLLTLAALDQPQPRPFRRIDVAEAARRLLIAALPRADARQVELALLADEPVWALLDPLALDSILGNLLDNAIHYGGQPGGRIELGVRVRCCSDGSPPSLHLIVADDGPGIAPAERTRLLRRFERGRDVRASGCGLGLPIVAQAVHCLGGRLSLDEGLHGRGIAFHVQLPWRDPGAAAG